MTAALKLIGYQINHKKYIDCERNSNAERKHENPVKHM
jgi:hypothetical protein